MLELILGAAGTGKSALLQERIAQAVRAGRRAMLLVPEQASFESEKQLYRALGAVDALSVEVLSFTRLCDRIFRELGGLAGVQLDETAKYLLMSVALGELGGALRIYGRNAGDAALAETMCATVSELKAAGVAPETLRTVAGQSDEGLCDKLEDLALIYETYQALIEQGYADPDDALRRACKRLEEDGSFLEEYEVFIDGFMAFMGAEWKLIALLLEYCPKVTVAVAAEGLEMPGLLGALSAPAKTARRMIETAARCGAPMQGEPLVLREGVRFGNPALAALARELPRVRPQPFDGATEGVQVCACDDFYDELELVAAGIARLVREEGYRYREIVVIARDLERYLAPLQTVFARYEIPYFTDMRYDVQVYPLVSAVLGALEAVRGNCPTETMLALAKNSAVGLDLLDAAALENYCYVWSVEGSGWREAFRENPSGMADAFTEEQTALLSRINAVRERLVTPIGRLGAALRDCDGEGFAGAVFAYLEQIHAADNLCAGAAEMEAGEEKTFLDLGAQVWDLLIGVLEVFGGALARVHLPLARLIELFRMSLASADLGMLPQTIDQVIVGTADRIRPNAPRAAFVIGLNEGIFPRWESGGGLFSAHERGQLAACGVDLLRTPEQAACFERYYLYFALTQASERLVLCYPTRDAAGVALTASDALAQVEAVVGKAGTSEEDPLGRIANEKTAFDAMTRGWREDSARQASLRAYFAQREGERLEALIRAADPSAFALYDRQTARALFGAQMRLSPSKAERYYGCPFSYFCQSGLQLRVRRKAEFNPIESGSLIHLVLERMVAKYGGKGLLTLSDKQMREEITALIEEDLSARVSELSKMPARFQYLFRRLVGTLVRMLRRLGEEFAQSEFLPEAFELPIREGTAHEPLNLTTPDGTRILVEGVVDRVDSCKKRGKRYLRVVDYKSGTKEFNLCDVYYGLNMQMLIYLFALCAKEGDTADASLPAGVLYLPARDSIISADRHTDADAVRDEQRKRLRMNGLLLDDREILSAMEPELAGVFIPAKTKKDGSFDAYSSLATLTQFGQLKRRVENLLIGIAESLHGGEIPAMPAQGRGTSPCEWCDYRAVCGHEAEDPARQLAELDRRAVLTKLGEEARDGEAMDTTAATGD